MLKQLSVSPALIKEQNSYSSIIRVVHYILCSISPDFSLLSSCIFKLYFHFIYSHTVLISIPSFSTFHSRPFTALHLNLGQTVRTHGKLSRQKLWISLITFCSLVEVVPDIEINCQSV